MNRLEAIVAEKGETMKNHNTAEAEERQEKSTDQYVKVRYGDRVVFTEERQGKKVQDPLAVWRGCQGLWSDHPVFRDMEVREIVVWIRGEDSDI
jgi:hypothetical protein